jgi:outer membrane protein assembly factor BamB
MRASCVLSLALALQVYAGDWPGFRGPGANGVAECEQAPTHFGPGSNMLWKVEALPGHSSPVLWKDKLFLTGAESNKLTTTCFDRVSGQKLWEQAFVADKLEQVHESNSHATPTPVTDGKGLYVYFGSFGLVAYDFSGKEIWRKPLPIPKTFNHQGTGTSPILCGDRLIVFLSLEKDSYLLAVSPVDGSEIWHAPAPEYNNTWASPVAWKEGARSFVGITCAKRFSAFQLEDGKEAWWVSDLAMQTCATPVVAGDRLIITTAGVQGETANITPPPTFDEMIKKYDHDGDGLIAFDEIPADLLFTDRHAAQGRGNMPVRMAFGMFGGVKSGDKLDRQKYDEIRSALVGFGMGQWNQTLALCVRTGGKEEVNKSQIVWKETKGVPEVPSPLVLGERLYLIRSGGLLVCRDLATGNLIYEERINPAGGYFASPVAAGGRIYLASDAGLVTVAKAGDTFEVLAQNKLGEPIIASPAIVDGTLYVRSASKLWAFADAK